MAKEALTAWGLTQLLDRVVLVVSELVTNAVQHARPETPEVRLVLRCGEELLVEIHDGDPRLPRPLHPEPDAASGWGLLLVAESSTRWGAYRAEDGGKCVWATFAT